MDDEEKAIRKKLRDDLEHYAKKCLKIRPKKGALEPLIFNDAQRFIHECLEQQKRETGKVRALILKGRQMGCSTYTEGRFYQQTTHRKGVLAYILTHQDDATATLFEMVERYHVNCPPLVKPTTSTSNRKELSFDRLDSGYKVSTAGSKGAGRSSTITLFHGSEVAYWPNAEKHMSGALQAVPNAPGTEVILESTSDGPKGLFYEMCRAAEAGQGEYQLIFCPWFWQSEYRLPAGPDFQPTNEEAEYAEAWGLDLEQLAWRRAKIVELRGVDSFRREYPANVKEAFTADAKGAQWRRSVLNKNRVDVAPQLERIVVAVDPQATNNPNSAETGIAVGGIGWCDCKGKPELHGFYLKDPSIKGSPNEWGAEAVDAYRTWLADLMIGEVNNGGDMVEMVIKTVDPSVNYKAVHASRGKVARSEPIAALDEQGKIHHVGFHPALEDSMCTWKPGDKSPDRIDARTWLFTELMIDTGLDQGTAEAGGQVEPEAFYHTSDDWEF